MKSLTAYRLNAYNHPKLNPNQHKTKHEEDDTIMVTTGTAPILLDFTSLTSQHYRPAQCTEIHVKEGLKLKKTKNKKSENNENSKQKAKAKQEGQTVMVGNDGDDHDVSLSYDGDDGQDQDESVHHQIQGQIDREWEETQMGNFENGIMNNVQKWLEAKDVAESLFEDAISSSEDYLCKRVIRGDKEVENDRQWLTKDGGHLYHGLTLDDWEQNIRWDGAEAVKNIKSNSNVSLMVEETKDLLRRPINLELENGDFSKYISWDGVDAKQGVNEMFSKQVGRLILDKKYMGQSLSLVRAKQTRPQSFSDTIIFSERLQKELTNRSVSSTSVFVSAATPLHANKDELEKIIAEKQQKRERLAKDKASRVTDAMKDLDLGPGKGRSVTSSLMGPGKLPLSTRK